MANDLRVRMYERLERLSPSYCGSAKCGMLMSSITSDVSTMQNFASASTLGRLAGRG